MSRIVPDARAERLQFYETHVGPWLEHTLEIGVSADAVALLADAAAEARAAYDAQQQALLAARTATNRFNLAMERLHSAPGLGADMVQTIKTFAESTANREVYTLAQIAAPRPPAGRGSGPPPGTPSNFTTELLPDGSLVLRWQCRHERGAAGIMYEVRRRVGDVGKGAGSGGEAGPLEFLGTAGRRSFRDQTLPRGAGRVMYEVTPVRSTGRGHAGVFVVNLGVVGVVGAGASPVKMAA